LLWIGREEVYPAAATRALCPLAGGTLIALGNRLPALTLILFGLKLPFCDRATDLFAGTSAAVAALFCSTKPLH